MSRYTQLIVELADRFRRIDAKTLVYFHTDHFEPWRAIGNTAAVGPEIVENIYNFCRATERIDFARRLTLFYKPHLNYALRRDHGLKRADADDLVAFLPRTDFEEETGRTAMRQIVASSSHDIQLHIHHEYYTASKGHTDPEAIAWFAGPLGRALDEQRLELAITLYREIIARETGYTAARWFFAHGQWALNASDDSACTITNELALLLRNGCGGDFTFPAGRPHVNPRIKVPYFCRPVDRPKAYDTSLAEPEIACGNAGASASKFFIWSSPGTGMHCSLDYMSEASRRHLANAKQAALNLIETGYCENKVLFIKTHAHSMHRYYFEHARLPVFPHQLPTSQAVLSVVFDAAATAGLDVRFLTAPEVYDLLVSLAPKPDVNLGTTYLRLAASERRRPQGFTRPVSKATEAALARNIPSPLALARALELVRETAALVLRRRIEERGIDGSGAYDYYGTMLSRGLPIPDYLLAALDIVRHRLPSLQSYHEIGSGIGLLPFLLANEGLPAVGIECDRHRHETAKEIWRELVRKTTVGETPCRLLCARFPRFISLRSTAQSVAILTNFVTTKAPCEVNEILYGLRHYRYVLIDLQRFCIVRETAEARLELLNELRTSGFVPIGDIVEDGDYCFALLQSEAAQTRTNFTGFWLELGRRVGLSLHVSRLVLEQ